MIIDILTLFPETLGDVLSESILGRAQERGFITIDTHQIREYTANKQMQVDDYPYGGGRGAVMQADPLYRCWEAVCDKAGGPVHTIYLSPCGKTFKQEDAIRLSKLDNIVFVCGHYEGIDNRILNYIDEEILNRDMSKAFVKVYIEDDEEAMAVVEEGKSKGFDITLTNQDGVDIQPDGTVKVKLPLDWEKEGNYKVYRVENDGSFTDMNAYQQGSHMVFETDHFSIYVIVFTPDETTEEEPETPDTPAEPDTSGCMCLCHKTDVFSELLMSIYRFLTKLLGVFPTCQCGVAHY